ncbi:MAG: 50S ribosomal protein L30 [Flammeovirgaceae bacterium]|nr:50S ribosomal protein L30 [Flammeovirgaceae bacterium]MDW8288764.1 50S ribosomal protein L30 [Flammeovirgaceae bacterium]
MAKIRITQVRSIIGVPKRQKDTIISLGLGRIGKKNELEATPQILGMVKKVNHLVSVENIG